MPIITLYQTPERNSVTSPRGVTGPVPYCGIPKVRYHSLQPVPSDPDLPLLQSDSIDCECQSSQKSKASSGSSPPLVTVLVAGSHKRPCEDEDNELDAEPDPTSPPSHLPLSHRGMPNMEQLRPIAMTTTRKKPVLELSELKES